MQRTVAYFAIISRHPRSFVAACPALTDCVTLGRSGSDAYKSIKDLIRRRLAQVMDDRSPLPSDPGVSVKHLQLNVLDIEKRGEH